MVTAAPITDTTPPTVTSVTPSGTGAAVSGNAVITFSEAMNATAGTVWLNSLTALSGGSWSAGNTVFTIAYSGLANNTLYTVNISGFKDIAGNTMTASAAHSFTTVDPATPPKTLTEITLNTGTVKKAYTQGDALDLTGLVVTAKYSDNSTATVTSGYTANPANGTPLNTVGNNTTVTITYAEGGVTRTATFTVTVTEYFRFEVTTDAAGETFYLPVNGNLGSNYTKAYDWVINWGDGVTETKTGTQNGANDNDGIPHTYAAAGAYTVTISPNGSSDAWLGAFGFGYNAFNWIYTPSGAANAQANKNRVTKVISPLTPLMTRTPAQINGGTAPDYEWAYTFSNCTNLTMGDEFTFSAEWNSITTVGNRFASTMFFNCSGAAFTMNSVFNLPQNITTVGNYFAYLMFSACHGTAFTMNSVFNLPQNINAVGTYFAGSMFEECYGAAFTMNDVFNLPQNITTVGNSFAANMFFGCRNEVFTMNAVFNLPQGITAVGNYFATQMFDDCYGAAFTMNAVFNLPQNITTVGTYFARYMFRDCRGAAFQVNGVFKFPALAQTEVDKTSVFEQTFANLGSNAQTRTAVSIINGNPAPNTDRNTFASSTGFSDVASIAANWR